jgi:hypothetical protein
MYIMSQCDEGGQKLEWKSRGQSRLAERCEGRQSQQIVLVMLLLLLLLLLLMMMMILMIII